ncbi:hypothetical protein NFI96_028858, partial [Prochilodus magdalenae]
MRLYSACALVFLTSTFSTGSESAVPSVTVKLHHAATLPCSERCSGVVRWTVFHNPTEVLAECDQTSCRSVKEGYQMIHDQYLKGNFSLTITDADFSKRARYTSDCDREHLCDVQLKMEPLNTTVQKKPGESIALELDVSDPVEVIYNGTGAAGPSSDPICTVDGRSTECRPEYEPRASLISALELRGLTPADSGVYTVRDIRNKEVLHTYTVTVQGDSDAQGRNRKPGESLSSAPSGSGSAAATVRVKLHDSATLPCSERCSSSARWTVLYKRSDTLAECDQTSCRSVKEGYQMIHDQYLKGDLSLTITDADLSKRTWYRCECDWIPSCNVQVQIERKSLNTRVQIKPGTSLKMDLDISDPVEVLYYSTGAAGPSSGQICTVDRGSLQCKPDYTQRASLLSGLELRGMKPSDSGVYIVRDNSTKEDIHIYTVTVQDDQPDPDRGNGGAVPVWFLTLQIMSYNYLHPANHPWDPIPSTLIQSVPMNLLPFITFTVSSSLSPGRVPPASRQRRSPRWLRHGEPRDPLVGPHQPGNHSTWFESMEECRYEAQVQLRSSSGSGPVQVQLRSRSTMQQYTPGVLIFLLSVFSTVMSCLCLILFTVSESAVPTVKVKLHDSATLPCSKRCSGVVRWIESRNPTEVLAECDQTSCRSVKEGYQMIHDQYLKGDLSLTITAADLSKRGLYTCTCGRSELCDVVLQVEPLNTAVQVKPGEGLVLKLDLSVPVEVIYNSTGGAGPSSVQICTVDGGSLQCRPDYTQRSSLISGLELRGLTVSEGGVYTVRDIRTKEVVHTCTVTVQ